MRTTLLLTCIIIAVVSSGLFLFSILRSSTKSKQNKIKRKDTFIRDYFSKFNHSEKLSILDETPREVFIGDRFYVLKPLKYRQYTRLCILFAKNLEKLQNENIDLSNADSAIGTIVEKSEDDFFKAIAMVLFFSRNQKEDDEIKIVEGIFKECHYLKENATVEQISRILEIIAIQNDIERALTAFNLIGGKKKTLAATFKMN